MILVKGVKKTFRAGDQRVEVPLSFQQLGIGEKLGDGRHGSERVVE